MEKITLDKTDIKVLAADSRLLILKLLLKRNHTQTELAKKLSLSVPTVKQHLNALEEAALVKVNVEGRKWKYYELTEKGEALLDPDGKKVMILLMTFLLVLVGGVAGVLKQLIAFIAPTPVAPVAQTAADVGSEEASYRTTQTVALSPPAVEAQQFPWGLVIYGAILIALGGTAWYFYHRRKKRLLKFGITHRPLM